ncbi:MAG TPA: STAS domain-containing protein [Terriglobales bacterium]|nr:STAS domain-containing protein [Terriglobales bacterium]
MKLNVEIQSVEQATVVHCRGRIAYRDEALALTEKIAGVLPHTRQLVLELSQVEMIDSAGLGELALMLTWARCLGRSIKLVAPQEPVRHVLELTNLASVFEIYPRVEDVVLAFRGQPFRELAFRGLPV